MARRGRKTNGEEAIDLVALLPWWLGLLLAVVSYFFFHALAKPPVLAVARVDQVGTAVIGGLIAGIDRLWDPVRLFYLAIVLGTTSVAMISFMFLLMVRVSDPLVPRAMFGVLNTLLYFPSGAIYPVEGFPQWLRWISYIDPFTYAVHALKALLLKDTGLPGIYSDIMVLVAFSVVLVGLSVAFFKRQI